MLPTSTGALGSQPVSKHLGMLRVKLVFVFVHVARVRVRVRVISEDAPSDRVALRIRACWIRTHRFSVRRAPRLAIAKRRHSGPQSGGIWIRFGWSRYNQNNAMLTHEREHLVKLQESRRPLSSGDAMVQMNTTEPMASRHVTCMHGLSRRHEPRWQVLRFCVCRMMR